MDAPLDREPFFGGAFMVGSISGPLFLHSIFSCKKRGAFIGGLGDGTGRI